jgi:hypothetical protein
MVNPSGVYKLPQPNTPTITLSIPAISSNISEQNSDQNSDGELLSIAGESIFDYDNKIH